MYVEDHENRVNFQLKVMETMKNAEYYNESKKHLEVNCDGMKNGLRIIKGFYDSREFVITEDTSVNYIDFELSNFSEDEENEILEKILNNNYYFKDGD